MYDHEGRRRVVAAAAASFRRDPRWTETQRIYRNERDRGDEFGERESSNRREGGRKGGDREGRKKGEGGRAGMDHLAAPQSSNEI